MALGEGWLPYDLAGNWCEECGRAKSYRLWPGVRTGCKTCDEVVTRHRCTGRPDLDSLGISATWTCADCGTVWAVTEEGAGCSECGCCDCRTEKRWTVSVPGDRIDTAPRHEPQPYTPFRNLFAGISARAISPPNSCYVMANGSMIHVKPGCRC